MTDELRKEIEVVGKYLYFKIGKRTYFKVDMIEMISLVLQKSKTDVKKLLKDNAIEIWTQSV